MTLFSCCSVLKSSVHSPSVGGNIELASVSLRSVGDIRGFGLCNASKLTWIRDTQEQNVVAGKPEGNQCRKMKRPYGEGSDVEPVAEPW